MAELMCNPRRIRVRATRLLAESWDHEVRRSVELTDQVVGEARVRERLSRSVGLPTLTALARVLGRTEGWEEGEDGVFRHPLDGGVLSYDPDSRDLEIVARVSDRVRATGAARATVRAEIRDTVAATGIGTYYDDEWGGITEEDATREANRDAEVALDAAAETARAKQREQAEKAHGDVLAGQAHRNALDTLAVLRGARERELADEASRLLTDIGADARALFHRALAEAYRDAILAYARTRRATGISSTEGPDGVLDIEFELEV
ncbi:hypothetical protein [Acrocarpospora macrocephala]